MIVTELHTWSNPTLYRKCPCVNVNPPDCVHISGGANWDGEPTAPDWGCRRRVVRPTRTQDSTRHMASRPKHTRGTPRAAELWYTPRPAVGLSREVS
eukprot:954288-Pyramimonas_sp.AAC.1